MKNKITAGGPLPHYVEQRKNLEAIKRILSKCLGWEDFLYLLRAAGLEDKIPEPFTFEDAKIAACAHNIETDTALAYITRKAYRMAVKAERRRRQKAANKDSRQARLDALRGVLDACLRAGDFKDAQEISAFVSRVCTAFITPPSRHSAQIVTKDPYSE